VEDEKPVRTCDNQSYRMAEAYAAVGSSLAVYHAKRTGVGQMVDVCSMEAVGMALENAPQFHDLEGKIRRGRGNEAGSGTVHPCRDGYVVLVSIMGKNKAMWDSFVRWMKEEDVPGWEVFRDARWVDPGYRSSREAYDLFCRIFEAYARKHHKLYLYETGQKHKVAISPVSNGKDLLENPQLESLQFWKKLQHPGLNGEVTFPGAPYDFGRLHWRLGPPAPVFGQHTAEILLELGFGQAEITAMAEEGVVHVAGDAPHAA